MGGVFICFQSPQKKTSGGIQWRRLSLGESQRNTLGRSSPAGSFSVFPGHFDILESFLGAPALEKCSARTCKGNGAIQGGIYLNQEKRKSRTSNGRPGLPAVDFISFHLEGDLYVSRRKIAFGLVSGLDSVLGVWEFLFSRAQTFRLS